MTPLKAFAVSGNLFTTHPVRVMKLEVTMNSGAAAGDYVQIHDSNVVPADNAVPVKSWPATETGYKEFEHGELVITSGLYVCVSSTAGTKTLSADTMDICQVELTYPEFPTGTSYAGGVATPAAAIQVWLNAAGPKRIISIELDASNQASPTWLMVFATDGVNVGDTPVATFPIKAGAVMLGAAALKFGNDGFSPFSMKNGARFIGGFVALSQTPGTYATNTNLSGLRVEYK